MIDEHAIFCNRVVDACFVLTAGTMFSFLWSFVFYSTSFFCDGSLLLSMNAVSTSHRMRCCRRSFFIDLMDGRPDQQNGGYCHKANDSHSTRRLHPFGCVTS